MKKVERDLRLLICGHELRVRWFAPLHPRERPVIFMLHPGLGSVTQWRDFPERLNAATGYAVAAYNRWGMGKQSG